MKTDADKLIAFLSMEAKDPATTLLGVGEMLGSWRVISFLGGGGFGEVYRVEHVRVGIVCALKILKADTENARKRFWKEAIFVARHGRMGMPRFFEAGTNDCGRPYFVMEMLSPKELPSCGHGIAVLLKQLCRIVGALHEEGFVHRDIKPSNVLYRENGDVVLVDYGLIKNVDNDGVSHDTQNSVTRANAAVGTEHYAAPEQLAGNPIDRHADIHALGVLIDACFNGRVPWRWRRIVCRATSSLVGQRYPSCAALSCAISCRFVWEVSIVLFVVALFAIAASIVVRSPETIYEDEQPPMVGVATNAEKFMDVKTASDSAGEWLTP